MRARICASLAAALVLGGCGGSGDDAPARIESKADYIAAGDKICLERDQSSAKLPTTVNSDADFARLMDRLADIYGSSIEGLQALELPPGADRPGAEKFARSVAAMNPPVQRMKAAATDLADAVAAKRGRAVKKAADELMIDVGAVQAIGDLADQNARTYGFRNCGQQQPPAPLS